ncbi:lipid-A-disaccharide synthase [Oligosphaera ethanolica]|uniref:Lipid-A-disaccharide synthase n=1 Tax=Oligosphaera ethanolica TaxID=760260 RepID=A0AAE4ANX1_9BACT|nr:lipid-A-disaccharide synthase [Oligosphaera ethanolica]MDQ0289348.1 lipid-A-disaccharide synthase [Oligosphaera ethanolica]NLE54315.1 lipid-A-disaccharide synthase [Lentisphaerota bacterium]HQL08133.1 lipid-A-disaccharide synthase [Lentisphaeria bacterium]
MSSSTDSPCVWIIAGEASGDNYGANLAQALRQRRPDLRLRGMGSEQMRAAGVELFVDSSELGVVGLIEVLKSIRFFIRLLRDVSARAIAERPAAVVLIDYPGFNLRLAERLHRAGIPVVYYISPQVWAWKKGRIPRIARDVDKMLCIFPFEPAVYAGTGLDASFVGHPLLEILAPLRRDPPPRDPNLVLLLPGSRSSELKALFPDFLRTAAQLQQARPELHFMVPLPRQSCLEQAKSLAAATPLPVALSLEYSVGETRQWLSRAAAGLAASGTVTVEAAILGLPLVVAYRLNAVTWHIVKHMVKLPFVTIANLVTKRCVYEEYLQDDAVPEKLAPALLTILPGGSRHDEVVAGIRECTLLLGGDNAISLRVADAVLAAMKNDAPNA